MVFDRVDVGFWVVKVWGNGGDEFGVCSVEEFFEDREGFRIIMLKFE